MYHIKIKLYNYYLQILLYRILFIMSSKSSTKRSIESLDEIYMTCKQKPRNDTESFESFINDNNTSNHQRYLVNLTGEQKCDAKKLHSSDLIFSFGYYNTIKKHLEDNPDTELECISNDYCNSSQYTKIEKISFQMIANKLKEIMSDNIVCRIEYYEESDAENISMYMRCGSKLIEESGESESDMQQMYKKLFERIQIGTYCIREGLFRRQDQKLDIILSGQLMFLDARYRTVDKPNIIPIRIRKIKAITYKLTRYEII